jgi:ATPase subunit of ABC transporter with duplicated ATPase domains
LEVSVHLRLRGIARRFGDAKLFEDINVDLGSAERVALLGRNGSGKTTLLKIIAGLEVADAGEVTRTGRIAYLAQRGELTPGSLRDAVLPEAHRILKVNLEVASRALEEPSDANLAAYSAAEEAYRVAGGYEIETRAEEILAGLELTGTLSSHALSGGQERRALLARLLIEPADLYLLDEPTNHLDTDSLLWLEGWIKASSAAFLIVSHDRAFLDATVTRCVELERGKLDDYSGNYTAAMAEKQTLLEAAKIAFQAHTRKVRQLEEQAQLAAQRAGAEMNRGKVRDGDKFAATFFHERGAQKASNRSKALEKRIEQMGELEKPFEDRFLTRIHLDDMPRGPSEVATLDSITVARGERVILQDVTLHLRRGEHVALVGPNGGGKSTLLRAILGQLPLTRGTVRLGIGLSVYWAGQHGEELDAYATLEEALLAANDTLETREVYALLASLGLPKDPKRTVSSLSGGQRTRLSLARLSVTRAQLLVLDEPTNNLDLDAINALERLLLAYTGTVLFASHDRRLVERVATRQWRVADSVVLEERV